MTTAELIAACRAAYHEPFATQYDHRHLLAMAADEIERLVLEAADKRDHSRAIQGGGLNGGDG